MEIPISIVGFKNMSYIARLPDCDPGNNTTLSKLPNPLPISSLNWQNDFCTNIYL